MDAEMPMQGSALMAHGTCSTTARAATAWEIEPLKNINNGHRLRLVTPDQRRGHPSRQVLEDHLLGLLGNPAGAVS